MKYGKLIVEKKELRTLRRLLSKAEDNGDSIYSASISKLSQELNNAETMDEIGMPAEVVRLNSLVTISMPLNKQKSFQLVLPEKSNIAENKLSIMAPMGLALFGYAKGDKVLWEFPSGMNKITVLDVVQPVLQT